MTIKPCKKCGVAETCPEGLATHACGVGPLEQVPAAELRRLRRVVRAAERWDDCYGKAGPSVAAEREASLHSAVAAYRKGKKR